MSNAYSTEIDRNFDYFQRNLAAFMVEHAGAFALMRSAAVVNFFPTPTQAYHYGLTHFADGLFSIQEVIRDPVDLGFFSYAPN